MRCLACSAWGLDQKMYDLRVTPTQSVQQVLQVIARLTPEDSGRFLKPDGSTFPF